MPALSGVEGNIERMSNRIVIIGFLAIFFTLSCKASSVEYDYNRETDFSGFHTYAWEPKMLDIFAGRVRSKIRQPININRIKIAIEAELSKKGMQKVKRNEADVQIAFHAKLEEKQDMVDWGYGDSYEKAYHGHYYDNDLSTEHFTEGTLFIDFINPVKNDVVWRGWSKRRIPNKVKEKLVNKVVMQILNKYPPVKK